VLIWQDFEGYHTAALVEWEERAALGRTAAEARDQLEEFLLWSYAKKPWLPAPDFLEPELAKFTVHVRPEYQIEGRPQPCDEMLSLTVYAVSGRQEGGLLVCALPMLNVRFYYYEADALKGLVTRYTQLKLQGLSPQALSRHLPPRRVLLDEVVVRVRPRETQHQWEPCLPTLTAVAEPLGQRGLRRQFGRAWEREEQVAECVRRLGRERANVLLVGDPGSGKTTVLVQAVQTLERKAEPEDGEEAPARARRRFWLTSGSRLIAGMKYLGQWEERCEAVIEELAAIDGVLCVDNLLDLVRIGGRSPSNSVAAFFLPYLQRGELRLAGEATPAELEACRRLLPGFADVFRTLELPAFTRRQALAVLDRAAASSRQDLHLEVEHGVTELVYRLFRRFAPYHAFPGKAVAFLAELFEHAGRSRGGVTPPLPRGVTVEQVYRQFVRRTGLPELFLRDDLPLPRSEVLEAFRRWVIGQEEACAAAADLVTTFKAGLQDPGRPVGVLLFCGPTGVGKTELARAIAAYFFGHGEQADRLIRLDMSEYAGPGAADRLVTQPGGEPSELIQKVRQQPFVVVLFDEIEKAAPEVFDVLLGVFDEGRLSDRFGRITVFRSAVLIMTSNLGAGKEEAFGFGRQAAVPYDAEALAFFRPEFFNRIDAVVTFRPLGEETILAITRKELAEVGRREGLARLGVRLTWTERAVRRLAQEGFDARYGARPLQRTLEALVVTPLARYLLDHPDLRGGELGLDYDPDREEFFFTAT
jgi:ATP-dependent Clp protease ATP-binding subunit ClpC